jgi:hypothetical protein
MLTYKALYPLLRVERVMLEKGEGREGSGGLVKTPQLSPPSGRFLHREGCDGGGTTSSVLESLVATPIGLKPRLTYRSCLY